MKSLYLVIITSLTFIAACEKADENPIKSFIGTWVIKKSLADPGDGSGRYRDVTVVPAPTLTFSADGKVSSNSSYFGLGMLDSYELLDSTRIKFNFQTLASYPTTTMWYKFKGDTLIINPPCIEGCGLKLVKQSTGQ